MIVFNAAQRANRLKGVVRDMLPGLRAFFERLVLDGVVES
jgi:hypothetical protein